MTIQSTLSGETDLAVGNVIGSNILNILIVLGLCAIVAPLTVDRSIVRREMPFLISISLLSYVFSRDGLMTRIEGVVLLGFALVYTGMAIVATRKQRKDRQVASKTDKGALWLNIGLCIGGLAFLMLGARWITSGAIAFASYLGVGEMVIGLTIVALGTSLPEVAASLFATYRGERDMAVGNVVGSCIFNLVIVLACAATISSTPIVVAQSSINLDIPVMVAVTVLCLPIFFSQYRMERWEGAIFVIFYVCYTAYLVLQATDSVWIPQYAFIMTWMVLPISFILFGISLTQRFWAKYM